MDDYTCSQGDKVLVFAPHNDDEILGTGGIIQRCLDSGASVKIAVVTNGDGQFRRPTFLPFFRADFVKLGYRRQKESLEALEYLGLEEDDTKFFGYPDRGLSSMWTNYWDYDNLYYSKYTNANHSPYENSYTDAAPYCGSAVVEDVKKLLLEVEPDVVYLPHPNDSHPDHWATNGFVLYGLEQLKSQSNTALEDVNMLTYLVHSVRFPFPRGEYLEASLNQPPNLKELDTEWLEVPLVFKERLRKLRAIGKYRTQTQLMRKYLVSFARANELFGVVPSLSLNQETVYEPTPNLPKDFVEGEKEDKSFLSYLNPKRKSRFAALRRYPDMRSVRVIKEPEVLKLAIDFFNTYRSSNEIQITLKPFGKNRERDEIGKSHAFRFHKGKLYHNDLETGRKEGYEYESDRKSYRLSVPLEKVGNPQKLILSITLARKGVPFARSANRLVKIN